VRLVSLQEGRSEASVLGDGGSLAPVREQSGGRLRLLRASVRAARGYGSAPAFAQDMGGLSAPAVVQAICALSKGCACVCVQKGAFLHASCSRVERFAYSRSGPVTSVTYVTSAVSCPKRFGVAMCTNAEGFTQ